MKFLSNQHILEHVRSLVGEDGEVRAAVAFWGSGAVEQTGIAQKRNGCVRVLCDLFSGACNPSEIQFLLDCPNVKIRTLHGMHAKVWANGDHVIVGSANASMNGLGFEAGAFNVEAAVQLRNRAKAKQVREWFEENWTVAMEVDQQVLTQVKEVWDNRQNSAPRPIMNYRIGASPAETLDNEVIRWCQESYPDVEDPEKCPVNVYPPGTAVPQPGTLILNFTSYNEGGDFTFTGTCQIDGERDSLDDGRQMVVLSNTDNPRFPISRGGVAQMVKCSVEENGWIRDKAGWYVFKNFADFFHGMRAKCQNRKDQCERCPFPQEGEV